jgi:hypothetical protein
MSALACGRTIAERSPTVESGLVRGAYAFSGGSVNTWTVRPRAIVIRRSYSMMALIPADRTCGRSSSANTLSASARSSETVAASRGAGEFAELLMVEPVGEEGDHAGQAVDARVDVPTSGDERIGRCRHGGS